MLQLYKTDQYIIIYVTIIIDKLLSIYVMLLLILIISTTSQCSRTST